MGVRFPQGGCKHPKKAFSRAFCLSCLKFAPNTLRKSLQTTSTSPCRTQVQPAASFLVCSLIFIEYKTENLILKNAQMLSSPVLE